MAGTGTTFPHDVSSAGQARSHLAAWCSTWCAAPVLDDAMIVVTELVENAIRHAHSPCEFRASRDDRTLTIEVSDSSGKPPHLLHPVASRPGGRGLLLVDRIARNWGYRMTPTGKTVWAELAVS